MSNSSAVQSRPRGRIPADELASHEEAFLDAAAALFRCHGFARVSIDMIARAAHVSPKTIYRWYGGKTGLFAAVIKRMLAPILATQDLFDDPQDADPIAVLRNVAARFLDRILEPDAVSLHRMMIAEAVHMPELSALYYREGYEVAVSRLAKWLAGQDAAGRLRVPTPRRAAEILAGLVGAGIVDRVLFLNEVPTADERVVLLEDALNIFALAHTRAGLPK
ncbi:MAG TPA: TetR/AcrR family transcriptional regulator [Ancylobacter sp.]